MREECIRIFIKLLNQSFLILNFKITNDLTPKKKKKKHPAEPHLISDSICYPRPFFFLLWMSHPIQQKILSEFIYFLNAPSYVFPLTRWIEPSLIHMVRWFNYCSFSFLGNIQAPKQKENNIWGIFYPEIIAHLPKRLNE
jgi:hypothetical protein